MVPGCLAIRKRDVAWGELKKAAALLQNGATLRYDERLPDLCGDPGN